MLLSMLSDRAMMFMAMLMVQALNGFGQITHAVVDHLDRPTLSYFLLQIGPNILADGDHLGRMGHQALQSSGVATLLGTFFEVKKVGIVDGLQPDLRADWRLEGVELLQ